MFPPQEAEQPDPRQDVNAVLQQFKTYCNPRRNTVYERHRFWSRDQLEGEAVDQWITELKVKAALCEFSDQRDLLIRDKIVFDVRDERVKERLLRESDLTLQKALDICRAAEATKEQVQAMNKEAMKVPIGAVRGTQKQRRNEPDTMPNLSSRIHDSGKSSKTRQAACKYCGGFHPPRQCPAYGKMCSACHKRNHLAKVCLQSAKQIRQVEFQVEDADEAGSDENEELLMSPIFIGHIRDTAEWTERLDLERAQIDF